MTTNYNSQYQGCYPFSTDTANMLLVASTALSVTVPGKNTETYRAKFSVSTSADVWVRQNATAAVPTSGTVATTSNQERIDIDYVRYVQGGDTLSFISTGTPQVGVSFLKLPS